MRRYKVLTLTECHIQKTSDGNYWSAGVVDYSIFSRLLGSFDEVRVIARVSEVEEKGAEYVHKCNGDRVDILPLPEYVGVWGYISNFLKVDRLIKEYCANADCAVIRTPNAISIQVLKAVNKKLIPYAIEVSGDPWKHMAPGEYKSVFRPLVRRFWTRDLKKICLKANGVAYVTKRALQSAYPCRAMLEGESENYFTSHYSTVNIQSKKVYPFKDYGEKTNIYHFIHITNALTTYSKGHLEAIDIVKRLNEAGFDISIEFVGDGPLKNEFKQYAKDKGIFEKTSFVGRLNSKELVWEELRKADLFLFPTHSEGLPRVVIESMYVGTPCISTNVGGIPELLDKECIVDVGDVDGMYEAVKKILVSPEKLTALSMHGIETAQEYTEDVLQARRIKFYDKLKKLCD